MLTAVALPAGNIISFASRRDEINTISLNQKLALEGRLHLPKIVGDSLQIFRVLNLSADLALSSLGIWEPIPEKCSPAENIAAILVPGLAFDQDHFRLGYGKGHHDRLLAHLSCPSFGIGFLEQLTDRLPREIHDRPVTKLLLF